MNELFHFSDFKVASSEKKIPRLESWFFFLSNSYFKKMSVLDFIFHIKKMNFIVIKNA